MTKCFECKWFLRKGSKFACTNKNVIAREGNKGDDFVAYASKSVPSLGMQHLPKNCDSFEKK